jgi:hypothetical protein
MDLTKEEAAEKEKPNPLQAAAANELSAQVRRPLERIVDQDLDR